MRADALDLLSQVQPAHVAAYDLSAQARELLDLAGASSSPAFLLRPWRQFVLQLALSVAAQLALRGALAHLHPSAAHARQHLVTELGGIALRLRHGQAAYDAACGV